MPAQPLQAFFLSKPSSRLFCIYHPSNRQAKQAILLVPPFGDEMNKSRRMTSLQARCFSRMGYPVLIVDLYGTGDSEGEFGEATWDVWRENLDQAWQWLRDQQGIASIHLWGIRLGSLLALDAARTFDWPVGSFLFWQPVTNGDRFVTQLLRLRIAEQFGQSERDTVKNLRKRSTEGETLEIAGYLVNADLLQAIAALRCDGLAPESAKQVSWLECTTAEPAELLPGSQNIIEQWQRDGVAVRSACVSGPSFWNSVEIEEVPELLEKSCTLFAEVADERD